MLTRNRSDANDIAVIRIIRSERTRNR